MARKGFLATLVGIAAFAVPSAFADKGGIPHDGSSGQGRPATQQTAVQGKALAKGHANAKGKALAKGHARAHGRALAKGHANAQAQVHGKALAKGHAKTQAPAVTNTHAKAGKTTICHATGSTKNPYVTITISNNAIPAHRRHQDGRDIIPAPAGGCPATAAQQPAAQQALAAPTNGASTTTPSAAAQGQVLGVSTTSGSSKPNKVSVLGATTSGRSPSASSSPSALATRSSGSKGLPFTGTDAIIVALLGLAALLLGVTARRATTNRG